MSAWDRKDSDQPWGQEGFESRAELDILREDREQLRRQSLAAHRVALRLQEDIDRLRDVIQEAADLIKQCNYTPARSLLLTALDGEKM